MDYRYLNTRGWMNEAALAAGEPTKSAAAPPPLPPAVVARRRLAAQTLGAFADDHVEVDEMAEDFHTVTGGPWPPGHAAGPTRQGPIAGGRPLPPPDGRPLPAPDGGLDTTPNLGGSGVFLYTVEEGQRVLMRRPNGSMDVITGPRRVWRGGNTFRPMTHFVAHPGDYLIVRFRDGHQDHLPGPSEVWFDPRVHQEVRQEEGLQLAAKEAVVVYSSKDGSAAVQRRVVHGPALFVPQPGEWLHTFSWHASKGGSKGVIKVPNGLVFQKLWLMPDQMYHDVSDVRTADDAVLTIRLMIFFELVDITTMLDATHDPIGDFVNAASSDVVGFVGGLDLESFKRQTDKLNELDAYKQLTVRAAQCGYRITKVVYRGYGAPDRLQLMQDQAIEARTKLQLERETMRQMQELVGYKLESRLQRAAKRRDEKTLEAEHHGGLQRTKTLAEIEARQAHSTFRRDQARLAAELRHTLAAQNDARHREHLASLREMGVDLTSYLTRGRADRVIELRGSNGSPQVHLDAGGDGGA